MKSKKFYRKCDVIFWFVFMGLPILVYLIRLVGISITHLNSYSDLSSWFSYINSNNSLLFTTTINDFDTLSIGFIKDLFTDLATELDITNIALFGAIFSYMASIVFYHLILDILLFVPKFFHSFLRRVDKYEE